MNPAERVAAARRELQDVQRTLMAALKDNNTRSRAPAVRLLHEVRSMLSPAYPYASQAGQDQVIDRIFQGKTGGTFVDVGGYDGITGSNSLYFEKWRGWSGVIVEPVAVQREKAENLRACPCLPYAVAETDGEAAFIAVTEGYTQMSGLADTYDADLLSKVRADPRHEETAITVETRRLSTILTEAGLSNPDFVSLDIEGGELACLRSFPFAEHRVGAWAIENNTGASDIAQIMRENGYNLVEFCGPDEIYVRADL